MNPPVKFTQALFYEIIVAGQVSAEWAVWFDGLRLDPLPDGRTRISGCLADQSALRGTLERIFDLNMQLVSVTLKES